MLEPLITASYVLLSLALFFLALVLSGHLLLWAVSITVAAVEWAIDALRGRRR